MGRKTKWFGAVKKVFSAESNKSRKSKAISKLPGKDSNSVEAPPATLMPHAEAVKQAGVESRQTGQALAVARPTGLMEFTGKAREEAAAIMIQTAFRGYLARRALHALKGLVRLKSLIHGDSVKRQATTTLHCMQTLARVQSQIRSRRIRMSEENQALQRQLLLKNEGELENLKMGDGWDDRVQSKEKIEASLLRRQEAAQRRERALAYAYSHQWKNSSKSGLFIDPGNPQWGWSWLERWMAARPCESWSTKDRDLSDDRASLKSTGGGGEITGAYARHDNNPAMQTHAAQKPVHPPSRQSLVTPPSKVKSASPQPVDDYRSTLNIQSERNRRHSIAGGSSARDDESLVSLPNSRVVPSYMVPTESARAKSRFQSASTERVETIPDKAPVASSKKRLSFPMGEKHAGITPAEIRRHSGPPKAGIALTA